MKLKKKYIYIENTKKEETKLDHNIYKERLTLYGYFVGRKQWHSHP